jgi:hypothetical protein
MNDKTIETVNALCGAWLQLIDENIIHPSACILAANVGKEALRYYGIDARPLPVQVVAQNAKLAEQIDAGLEPDWNSGAWGVGIDPDQEPPEGVNGWNGHLVLWLKADDALVDLTLGQMSRPERDINLRPLVVGGVTQEWLETGEDAVYGVETGARVVYRARPDLSGSWHHSPDWSKKKSLVGSVIKRMRAIITIA